MAGETTSSMVADLKKMLPVWAVISLATVGSLAAIRVSGVEYLRKGIYSHADTCQVGEVHFHSGEAIWRDLARKAVESPRTGNGISSLGVLKGNADLQRAREKLLEAINVCPRIVGAHDLLADLAWWDGDEVMTHYHLGMEHLQKNALESARIEFTTARELAPQDTKVELALLDVLSRQQDWDSARAALESSSGEVKNSANGLRLQAHFAKDGGDLVQAEALLKQALEKEPGFRPAVLDLVTIFHTTSDYSAGPDWLRENLAVAIAPEAADYHAIGLLYSQGGNYERALESFEAGLSIQQNSIVLLVEKALALYNLGRHQEAKVAADAALDKNPQEFLRIIAEKRFEALGQFAPNAS